MGEYVGDIPENSMTREAQRINPKFALFGKPRVSELLP
jgi:hypothetical protein